MSLLGAGKLHGAGEEAAQRLGLMSASRERHNLWGKALNSPEAEQRIASAKCDLPSAEALREAV